MNKVLNRPYFPFLVLSCLVAWVTWLRLASIASARSDLGWEDSLHLLSAAAYACLVIGCLGLRRAFFLFRKKSISPISIRSTFLIAFLLPLFVTLIPIGVENLPYHPELFQPLLALLSLQIWLPALQVFCLGCLLLLGERFNPAGIQVVGRAVAWWMPGLFGLGLWLAGSFSYQLAGLLNPVGAQNLMASPVRACLSAVLVLSLPVLEGSFFRGRLLPELRKRLNPTAAIFVCAGISALFSLQPVLWIPAFLAGVGFNFLAVLPSGLRTSIYAHAVYNMLALLILPGIIL